MKQTDTLTLGIISLCGSPYIGVATYAALTRDLVLIKSLCPVGWLIMTLVLVILLIGACIDQ